MDINTAARHFAVNRKTILQICNNQKTSREWGCILTGGKWMISNPPRSSKWYTVDRVATMMDKSRMQINRWCRNGTVQAIRIGRVYRIPKEEVLTLIRLRD